MRGYEWDFENSGLGGLFSSSYASICVIYVSVVFMLCGQLLLFGAECYCVFLEVVELDFEAENLFKEDVDELHL